MTLKLLKKNHNLKRNQKIKFTKNINIQTKYQKQTRNMLNMHRQYNYQLLSPLN